MPDGSCRTKPKILVLTNENPAWPAKDLIWAGEMLATMLAGLIEQGYVCEPHVFFDDLSGLDRYSPEEWLIWNWGEEFAGRPWTEVEVAAELERRGFAFTGSPAQALRSVQNRAEIKRRLAAAGLPTLPARVFTDPAEAAQWELYPAIVKGDNQHSSYGIGRDSVVTNAAELARRISFIRSEFEDEALVEPFLDTREFHVAVWGNAAPEALPPMELDFSTFHDMHDRLYTYEWKFDRSSVGYLNLKTACPAPADRPDWQARLMQVAVAAYQAVGLTGYGRIDLRMLGDEPQILDVNANPDLDVTSVLPVSSRAAGYTYGGMAARIVDYAVEHWSLETSTRRLL